MKLGKVEELIIATSKVTTITQMLIHYLLSILTNCQATLSIQKPVEFCQKSHILRRNSSNNHSHYKSAKRKIQTGWNQEAYMNIQEAIELEDT